MYDDKQSEGFEIQSPLMKEKYKEISSFAYHNRPCIFLGPTGSGKEFAARYYHKVWEKNKNGTGEFVSINCAMLSESTARSELFGHLKGSFTGATYDKKGLFKESENGVLFLDEIGELPENIQSMLLRAIDPNILKARELGADKDYNTDKVRVLAATNQPLNSIRKEIVHRLGMHITIPGIEKRPEDIESAIPFLIINALSNRKDKYKLYKILFKTKSETNEWNKDENIVSLSNDLTEKLLKHIKIRTWPGNFRSLKNTIDSAVFCTDLMEDQNTFVNNIIILFNKYADTYGKQKSYFINEFKAKPKIESEIANNPVYQKIRKILPNIKEEEKLIWFNCFETLKGSSFKRRDIEQFFPVEYKNKTRTFQGRIKILRDAKIIEHKKNNTYSILNSEEIMPISKKQHFDLFQLPQNIFSNYINPDDIVKLKKYLDNSKHLFIGGPEKSGKTSLSVALGREIEKDRAVYYFNFNQNNFEDFFLNILQKLKDVNVGANIKTLQPAQTPWNIMIYLLTGYIDVLFQNDENPIFILDSVQNIHQNISKRALEIMLSYWNTFQFIIVGSKLSVPMTRMGIVEYRID